MCGVNGNAEKKSTYMVIRGVPRAPGPSGSVQKVPLKVEEREKEKEKEEVEKEVPAPDEGLLKTKSHIADEIYPRKLIQVVSSIIWRADAYRDGRYHRIQFDQRRFCCF